MIQAFSPEFTLLAAGLITLLRGSFQKKFDFIPLVLGFILLNLISPPIAFQKDLLASSASLLAILFSWPWMRKTQDAEEKSILAFAMIGMLTTVSSSNFLVIFLGLTLQSLSMAIVMGKNNLQSAIKYFVITAIGSAIFLYGCALLPVFLKLGSTLILSAIFLKLALFPFYAWAPTVYGKATNAQVALLATSMKLTLFVVLVRLLHHAIEASSLLILTVGIASCWSGALGGLWQTNVRRLMAYSGIANAGFMLLGFAEPNLFALFFYAASYFTATFGFFIGISHQENLQGIGKTNPLLALFLTACLLSMAGIPPLPGFFGKFYILVSLVKSGNIISALLAILSSVVAVFYYLRLIKLMYFEDHD